MPTAGQCHTLATTRSQATRTRGTSLELGHGMLWPPAARAVFAGAPGAAGWGRGGHVWQSATSRRTGRVSLEAVAEQEASGSVLLPDGAAERHGAAGRRRDRGGRADRGTDHRRRRQHQLRRHDDHHQSEEPGDHDQLADLLHGAQRDGRFQPARQLLPRDQLCRGRRSLRPAGCAERRRPRLHPEQRRDHLHRHLACQRRRLAGDDGDDHRRRSHARRSTSRARAPDR